MTTHNPYNLPDWLSELLPEPESPQLLALTADGKLELIQPDGNTELFDELSAAYEASRGYSQDLKISDEVIARFGDERSRFLSLPADKRGFSTLLLSTSERDRIARLEDSYEEFLELAKRYEASPEDFTLAWRFIDSHPAFWSNMDIEKHPYHWAQEGHCAQLRIGVYLSEEKEPVVELETGSSVPPLYKEHYADWRLEVYAKTYEEAIVELAERLSKAHRLDGTDNPNAAEFFEKPRWVSELEERIAEIDEEPEAD